ncbi:MAG: hypothetical protein ACRDWY_08635 [Actinomycetes bacterium]
MSTRRQLAWVGPLLVAAVGFAGCSDSNADAEGAGQDESAPPAPKPGRTLFTDPLDDDRNGWALPDNHLGSMEYVDGDFVWHSKEPNLRPHLLAAPIADQFDAGTLEMQDVVVTADVTSARGAAAMGVFCREVTDTDADFQWYEFVVRDGYAAIRHADSAGRLELLAETKTLDIPDGAKTSVQAACVDDEQGRAQLWLSVDGATTLHTTVDDGLGNGAAGLQAYDAPEGATAGRFVIRWHEFTVSEPAG